MAKMTKEHKEALARGRKEARAVRRYLEALDRDRRRGRRVSEETLRKQISELGERIEGEDDPATRVELIQRRIDLEEQLASQEDEPDMDALQAGFIEVANAYSERKGISYSAWREEGVPAAVLREAGVPRTRRTA